MNILLLGYGKMGKAIEVIAVKRGHQITGRIDSENDRHEFNQIAETDVAIEFSQPEAAPNNLKFCFDHSLPVICGTTGWLDHKADIEEYCRKTNGTFFQSSNFSLGVNLFFKVNEYVAKLMDKYPHYSVSIDEIHHTQKKDTPSGTAISLAEGIIKNMQRKKNWSSNATSNPEILVINSFRVDPDPGTHIVKYQSETDDIEIKHKAHSREGFALGAVMVAEWIKGKKGIFTMTDFLGF